MYNLARQWYKGQRQLRGVATGLAHPAGLLSLECGWRDRLVQEESRRRGGALCRLRRQQAGGAS